MNDKQKEPVANVDDQSKLLDQLDQEEELSSASDIASASTSSGKKKKKKSKASKALNALRGDSEISQRVVERVLDEVKAEGSTASAQANQENVREALEKLKIMDVVKGKAGIGGINKKDMGEHKVRFCDVFTCDLQLTDHDSSGERNPYPSLVNLYCVSQIFRAHAVTYQVKDRPSTMATSNLLNHERKSDKTHTPCQRILSGRYLT
ncbi:hypothetical protein C0993_011660 [Termitomyces sp. T159_Od127]|nr:hypothetical protein C0993_011660 [Termitomyces sp. T159_Od127]